MTSRTTTFAASLVALAAMALGACGSDAKSSSTTPITSPAVA